MATIRWLGDDLLDVHVDLEVAKAPNDDAACGQRPAGGIGEEGADGGLVGDGGENGVYGRLDDAGEGEAEGLVVGHLNSSPVNRWVRGRGEHLPDTTSVSVNLLRART